MFGNVLKEFAVCIFTVEVISIFAYFLGNFCGIWEFCGSTSFTLLCDSKRRHLSHALSTSRVCDHKNTNITIWLYQLQSTNIANVTVQFSELPCIQLILGSQKCMQVCFCMQLNCAVLWHYMLAGHLTCTQSSLSSPTFRFPHVPCLVVLATP